MGFSSNEVNRLVFKVQAGNVIDASSGKFWYESIFPNNPALLADRVLTQFDQVKLYPAANLAAAQSASTTLPSIIEDRSSSIIRLTQAVSGENNTWVAYATYSVPSSGILDLWIQPQRVPQSNGDPSAGYEIALYSGDPSSGGVYISTTVGQSGGEVGWVFNYDMGLLFLANDLVNTIQSDTSTYPSGLDFYIQGFRYIGETLADGNISGASFSFATSSTIDFSQNGITYSFFIQPNSITASLLNTGTNGGATSGYVLSVDNDGNFVWSQFAGSSGTSGTDGSSGTSGTDGSSGTSGTDGSSGTSGTDGSSGTSGTDGSSGTSGTDGSSGTSGTDGSSGTSGTDGSSGTSGTDGSAGTSGVTTQLELYNTDTITFVTQSTPNGLSASAIIATASITTGLLATASNGGATAGYILSNTGDGNFAWVPQSSGTALDVVDYITGETFSSVSTMIFRGGNLTVPVNSTLAGATATGVSVTGPAPVVTVWIPAPNYVGYFSPSLGGGSARYISQPTTNTYNSTAGNSGQFGVGTWDPGTNFTASTTRSTINSSGNLTAFTEAEFGCFNNGTTMSFTLYNYDSSVLYSIQNYVINGAGSTTSNGLTITVNSFSADNDRYKANVSGTIAVGTIFPNGGRFSWNVTHYNGEGAGNSGYGIYSFTSTDLFYDNDGSSSSANIAGGANFDELTPTTVQYSGVKFYAASSTFALTASNINLLNDISFPTTKQIDFTCFSMAISGSLDGYADGTKGAGSAITGWTIDWNKSGLTYSRTATVNSGSNYIPGFSTNNTISSTPASYVRSTIYDWSTVGYSQSTSRAMLFDTYSPSSVTYNNNPIDSETGRLSTTGVLTSGSSAFDSTLSLSTTNTDELQYIFGRVIYPQTDFTAFYPTFNWSASVNYSSLSGANKTFTVYTNINTGSTTTLSLNGYRWHVTAYGKDSSYTTSFGNGIFTLNSNFSESYLHYDGVNSATGSQDLVILVGIDDTSNNTTPNKFLFVSGDPVTYATRQAPVTYNLNKSAASKDIQWSKGTLSPVVKKVWLFIGYNNTATGKNLNMTNIAFS